MNFLRVVKTPNLSVRKWFSPNLQKWREVGVPTFDTEKLLGDWNHLKKNSIETGERKKFVKKNSKIFFFFLIFSLKSNFRVFSSVPQVRKIILKKKKVTNSPNVFSVLSRFIQTMIRIFRIAKTAWKSNFIRVDKTFSH